jgi:TonB family protein
MTSNPFLAAAAIALIGGIASPIAADQKGNADYPPEALKKHEQGTVLVDLTIGTAGRVTDCSVLVSSNSTALDQETCKQFVARLSFTPARDADGKPREDHAKGKISWVMPGCPASPQTDPRLAEQVAVSGTTTSLKGC